MYVFVLIFLVPLLAGLFAPSVRRGRGSGGQRTLSPSGNEIRGNDYSTRRNTQRLEGQRHEIRIRKNREDN